MRATIRQFCDADFGGVLRLWQTEGWTALGPDGLTLDQAIELLRADGSVAVVSETDGEISGAAVGAVVGPTAWILRLAAASGEDLAAPRLRARDAGRGAWSSAHRCPRARGRRPDGARAARVRV